MKKAAEFVIVGKDNLTVAEVSCGVVPAILSIPLSKCFKAHSSSNQPVHQRGVSNDNDSPAGFIRMGD